MMSYISIKYINRAILAAQTIDTCYNSSTGNSLFSSPSQIRVNIFKCLLDHASGTISKSGNAKATSPPGSSLYLKKAPWLRLVTSPCMPTLAAQRVGPRLNFVNTV